MKMTLHVCVGVCMKGWVRGRMRRGRKGAKGQEGEGSIGGETRRRGTRALTRTGDDHSYEPGCERTRIAVRVDGGHLFRKEQRAGRGRGSGAVISARFSGDAEDEQLTRSRVAL